MDLKPSRKLFAKAVPAKGGFKGQFALAGIPPRFVSSNGEEITYPTEDQAESEACKALVKLLTSRVQNTSKAGDYKRMSAEEFGFVLSEINVTAAYFAKLYGTSYKRVMMWLDAEADIPHTVNVFSRLLLNSENYEIVEKMTSEALEE